MAQVDIARNGRRLAAVARARLVSARWTLAASSVAIAAVALVGGAPVWVAAAAVAGICAVTALAPRRVSVTAPAPATALASAAGIDDLSAIDLAAVAPDPILICDGHAAALYANPAAIAAFGRIPRGALLPLKFRAPEMQRFIASVIAGQRVAPIDYVERVPIDRSFGVFAMPVGNGRDLFVIQFKDQSEVRRIDRMRADFIANASHELRTPLASISGFIETLQGPARNDEKARESFLQIMQAQTARMARLIDDLLSLSRLEMKPLARAGEQVDIAETVGAVVEQLSHLAAENGVRIVYERPSDPLPVPGSRDELIQVFVNLLENACKYGRSGGRVDVTLERTAVGQTPEVAVTVRDYGPGIAEEHIPRITERFYRVDMEASRNQKGTGLGLAIVKHILTRHEGRLTVRSTLGEGASFTAHLPARAPTA